MSGWIIASTLVEASYNTIRLHNFVPVTLTTPERNSQSFRKNLNNYNKEMLFSDIDLGCFLRYDTECRDLGGSWRKHFD